MADLTYIIYNNSTNTTATIKYFDISTNFSEQQHRLKIPITWNPPFNASPYTNFTNSSTLRSEVKTYTDDTGSINYTTTATTTGTTLYLTSNSGIQLGWTVFNSSYITSGQTVTNFVGTTAVVISAAPDVVPFSSGAAITFTPPEFLLDVNNTTNLVVGWVATGNGYNGQTILEVRSGTRLVMSNQPSTNPTPSGNITFTSNDDNMLEIAPLSSSTFVMDYDRITSSYGTYTSIVNMYATLDSPVTKVINNFMVVSAVPVTDPSSPFYESPGGAADAPSCNDNASVSCSAGGSGGSKVICTELYNQGLLDENIYKIDQAFGKHLLVKNPQAYWGYRLWADILVNYMQGQGNPIIPKLFFWLSKAKQQDLSKKIAINIAKLLGKPFAYELARRQGAVKNFNLVGFLLVSLGLKICKLIGIIKRK